MYPTCGPVNADTSNKLCINGRNKTAFSNNNPTPKAIQLYLFENNPIENIDLSPLQLNPWNSLAKHSVAKAIVEPTASFTFRPIWNAAKVNIEITKPSRAISVIRSLDSIEEFLPLGLSFNKSFETFPFLLQ